MFVVLSLCQISSADMFNPTVLGSFTNNSNQVGLYTTLCGRQDGVLGVRLLFLRMYLRTMVSVCTRRDFLVAQREERKEPASSRQLAFTSHLEMASFCIMDGTRVVRAYLMHVRSSGCEAHRRFILLCVGLRICYGICFFDDLAHRYP